MRAMQARARGGGGPGLPWQGVVTLFEMWAREADTALFRQAVRLRLPTRP